MLRNVLISLSFLFLIISVSAYASTAIVSWDTSPEEDLVEGFNLYQDDIVIAPMFDGTEIEVGITGGECFHVTAVNLIGESLPSEKSCAPNTVPNAPSGVKIVNIHITIN